MKITAKDRWYRGDTGWESDGELFAKVTVTWKQWLGHSGEHLQVAQVLLPEVLRHNEIVEGLQKAKVKTARIPPSVTDVYFFHCALAIENAFKGVIAFKSSVEIEQDVLSTGRLPRTLLGHDLLKLAERAGFQVDLDDEYTLTFLTRYGIWSGKYPLPIYNRDYGLTAKLSDGKHYMVGGYRLDTIPSFLSFAGDIYQRARSSIEGADRSSEPKDRIES